MIKIYTEGERDINLDEHIQREREKEKGIHINLMRNFTGREREISIW